MFLFLLKTEFQLNYGQFCDIPYLPIDSVFIGQFCNSVCDSMIVEIIGPYSILVSLSDLIKWKRTLSHSFQWGGGVFCCCNRGGFLKQTTTPQFQLKIEAESTFEETQSDVKLRWLIRSPADQSELSWTTREQNDAPTLTYKPAANRPTSGLVWNASQLCIANSEGCHKKEKQFLEYEYLLLFFNLCS